MRTLVIVLASLAAGCSCGDVHVRADAAGDDAGVADAGTDAHDAPIRVPSCDELFAAPVDETLSGSGDFTCDDTTIPLALSHLETRARWPATVLRSCFRVTRATEASGWRVGDEASVESGAFQPWIAGPGGEIELDSRAFTSDGTVVAQALGSLPIRTPEIDTFAERLFFAADRGAVRATATEVNAYGRLHPASDPRVRVGHTPDVVWLEATPTGARFGLARSTDDVLSIELPGVSPNASLLLPDGIEPYAWLVVSGARGIPIRRSEGTSGPLEIDRELALVGGELATAHSLRGEEILARVGDEVLRFDRASGVLLGRREGVRALLDGGLVLESGTVERWRGPDEATLAFDLADLDAVGSLLLVADRVLVGTAGIAGALGDEWGDHPGPHFVPWSVLGLEGSVHTAHWDGRRVSLVVHTRDGGSAVALLDTSFRGCD